MKKLLAFLIVLLLLTCPAFADDTPSPFDIAGLSGTDFIVSYAADNGQVLYFTSMYHHPAELPQDINFDGIDDLVFLTATGAGNTYYTFFVNLNGKYERVFLMGHENDAACNFQLYPDQQLLSVSVSHGAAGALCEKVLFRWAGTNLLPVRRMVSEEYTETTHDEQTTTTVTHHDQVHVSFCRFEESTFVGDVYAKQNLSLYDVNEETLTQWDSILWQDLQ